MLAGSDGTPLAATLVEHGERNVGVVVVHGLGSRRHNHLDMCELIAEAGMSALAVDLRGHGDTGGVLDEGAVGDVVAGIDALVARGRHRVALRGSSLGGLLCLQAAVRHEAVTAVAAICPADPAALATRVGSWPLRMPPLTEVVASADGVARGYWHARGDEVVPWAHTFSLAQHTPQPCELRIVMGGHHRSLQHDPVVQRETLGFLQRYLQP